MPFNGSGTFLRVRNWVNDATADIKIRADRHDSEDDNLASGLSQCITKDGQTTITANLPMSTYRHTNVGAATAITDYARYDQVQLGKGVWAVAGGAADAITATYSPATTAPVDGQLYFVRAGAANATTTPTFAPDGQTARTIVKKGGVALVAGDVSGAGHELVLRYNLANTRYELLNPANPLLDEDDFSSNSNLQAPTQQSVKVYVDTYATLPVGSIYMNASVSTNPATLLGYGTWTAIGVDRVLIGVGSTYPTAGATGGSATQTLSSGNNGPHGHTFRANNAAGTAANGLYQGFGGSIGTTNMSYSAAVASSGSGTAFSIVQPYEVVYMWKRTA